VLFPQDSGANLAAASSECAIVYPSQDEGIAFLRLSQASARQPLEIANRGLPNGLDVEVPVVESISPTKPIGEIRILRCRAAQRSLALPEFSHDLAPVAALASCPIELTGHGAPVIDRRGEALAAILGGDSSVSELQDDLYPIVGETHLADFGHAANLACLRTPLDPDREVPAACASARPSNRPRARTGVSDVVNVSALGEACGELERRVAPWRDAANQRFRWNLPAVPARVSSDLTPVIACIQKPEQWLGEYKHWYYFGGYDSKASVSVQVPGYGVRFEVNAFAQTVVKVTDLKPTTYVVNFSPESIAKTGATSATLQYKDASGRLSAASQAFPLKKCP
jgi:hypothetical protein